MWLIMAILGAVVAAIVIVAIIGGVCWKLGKSSQVNRRQNYNMNLNAPPLQQQNIHIQNNTLGIPNNAPIMNRSRHNGINLNLDPHNQIPSNRPLSFEIK